MSAITFLIANAAFAMVAFASMKLDERMSAATETLDRAALAIVEASRVAAPSAPATSASQPAASAPTWPPELGILRLSWTAFLVDRRVIDAALEHQANLMRAVRIVPESEHGRVVGIRLFGIRPDSLLGLIGFENGDRLQSVNGLDVCAPERALEAYARLRTADNLSVLVTRRDAAVRLEYRIF